MARILYVNPTLRARDVKALAEWYRDALGFEIRLFWGDPPSHAIVGRDQIRLGIAPLESNFGPSAAYIHVTGVNELYAEFVSRNVPINRPLELTDYRMKDFDLIDPEGNRLCFGEMIETAGPD
ncbi:MAG TPA: glyoxalase superfamily protein [Terracidiphilus sp.]|nr:glyoxalase superfamily protein [Terracidiphilus sp.]